MTENVLSVTIEPAFEAARTTGTSPSGCSIPISATGAATIGVDIRVPRIVVLVSRLPTPRKARGYTVIRLNALTFSRSVISSFDPPS